LLTLLKIKGQMLPVTQVAGTVSYY